MNYTTILRKGEGLLLWIYKNITNKFTSLYQKLLNKFPVLTRYPLLKYSLIPVLIGAFLLIRYLIKIVINESAAWTSSFVGEASGYAISERSIVLGIAVVFIILRVVLKIRNQRKDKVNEQELSYDKAK